MFVLFMTWALVLYCVCEYVDVVVFVSVFACSLVPRTVLRAQVFETSEVAVFGGFCARAVVYLTSVLDAVL